LFNVLNMTTKPDFVGKDNDLAVWKHTTEDGQTYLAIRDGENFLGNVFKREQNWFVYILECVGSGKNNRGELKFYTGETRDLDRRYKQHRSGRGGSTWINRYKWNVVSLGYIERKATESDALIREKQIKRWSHKKKLQEVLKFKELNSDHPLVEINEKIKRIEREDARKHGLR